MLPGHAYDLLLRACGNPGAMVLPITLNNHHLGRGTEQMLQGILTGAGAVPAIHSVAQWLNLRDILFINFAARHGQPVVFLHLFWPGRNACWRDMPWVGAAYRQPGCAHCHLPALSLHQPGLAGDRPAAGCCAACAAAHVLCVVLAALYALDLLSTRPQ